MTPLAAIVFATVLATGACFSEGPTEVAPTPDPLIVVQGVLRPSAAQQWVLVEKTFNGTSPRGGEFGVIPGAEVEIPVSGASVRLSNVSFPADPCGTETVMTESAAPAEQAQPGVYFATGGCPTLRQGDTITLTIEAEGQTVTGRTVIPAANSFSIATGAESHAVPGPRVNFNRDADTLSFGVDATEGRMLLVEVGERRFGNDRRFLTFEHAQFWVDGNELSLPGDAPNLFDDFDEDDPIPPLFRAGRYYRVTTAWTDQNFMDQLRSENSEITGRGFINSIDGGYGFLGSMLAAETTLRVVGDFDTPLEGRYAIEGTVDSVAVSLEMELYRNGGAAAGSGVSTLFDGNWVFGAYDAWAPGTLVDDLANINVFQPTGGTTAEGAPEVRLWEVRGRLRADAQSTLAVVVDGIRVGEVTATPLP